MFSPTLKTARAPLLLLALVACSALAQVSSEIPAQPVTPVVEAFEAEIETRDLEWFDTSRQRPVPVRLYMPTAKTTSQTVPLVIFSHGIGGSRRGYSYLGRYWASQGFASLHLQHVGSDRSLWSGNVFNLVERLQDAAREDEAIARVADLRFALDQLMADPMLAARINPARIVAAGHSYGANTVMLAVGARVERSGQVIELRDSRLRGAILLSAPPFYGESNLDRIVANIRVPTLHVTATEDIIRIPGYYSGAEDRIAVYEAMSGSRKVLAVFNGGSHSMFTDRSASGGAELNAQVKAATRELSLAFLHTVFGDSDAGLQAWPLRHNGIVARFIAAGS